MAAATGRVAAIKPFCGDDPIPNAATYGLATGVADFRNWLMGINASGYAVAQAAGVTGLISGGFSDRDNAAASPAANNAATTLLRQQFVSGFANSTGTLDAILAADIAVPCWAVDNETVGKLSNYASVNRSLLGLAFGIDPDNGTPIIFPGVIGWLMARAALMADAFNFGELGIADAAANTAQAERAISSKKVHGTITAIQYVGAAAAADNTDYATITMSKRDGAGGGAVVLGTYDTRAANQGAITAFVPAVFSLSAVAGALNLLETDVITLTTVKGGAGKILTGAFRVIGKVL